WIVLGWQALPVTPVVMTAGAAAPVAGASNGPWLAIQVQPLPAWALSFVMMAWASVAFFRLLRIFPGLHALYRLKDEGRPFPPAVEQQLTLWQEGSGRGVRLVLCDGVPGAAVLGLHDPCIAV